MWDKTGYKIHGLYLKFLPFAGTVTESRVKFGGAVQHTVKLKKPITVFGAVRDTILVSDFSDKFSFGSK